MQQHKLSLFVDDIALYITDPDASLPEIDFLLDKFFKVSGLKINKEKSLLYPISLDKEQQHHIACKHPYIWVKEGWKNLGVMIPTDFVSFSKRILESTHAEVRKLLISRNDKMLTWFERIMKVKMMVFPKYLFLFWTAPLQVTLALLCSWQRALTDFVWSYKKPRLPLDLLTAPKADEGLALPSLKHYYDAAVLSTLLKHYLKSYQAAWKDTESHDFQDKPFQEILWMSRQSRTKRYNPSSLCCITL